KYDTNGNQKWVVRYQGSRRRTVTANAIAVDQAGNVCVTGYMSTSVWDTHSVGEASSIKGQFVTLKYDADGREQWIAKYTGPEGHEVWTYDLIIDTQGNIYVMGFVGSEALIIKYDATG
ncbi:unnamed protein product, partial [marine sediment metagenome]